MYGLEITLTVDGIVSTSQVSPTNTVTIPTSQKDTNQFFWAFLNPNIKFNKSLKIQIKNIATGTTRSIACFAQYNLV